MLHEFIRKTDVVILRPTEFRQIYDVLEVDRKGQIDGLLVTGMRYIEAQSLQQNQHWWDGDRFINLPRYGSAKKEKSSWEERTIRLSNYGKKAIKRFFDAPLLPARNNWDINLKNWAAKAGYTDTQGLCAKSTRKTWEAWLFTAFEPYQTRIMANQGHIQATSLKHYLNLSFYDNDKEAIKPYVEGWV